MISHELLKLPRQVTSGDLFSQGRREFLTLVDYYCVCFKVKPLKQRASKEMVVICGQVFTSHGIPARLVTNNGPPFSSHEF